MVFKARTNERSGEYHNDNDTQEALLPNQAALEERIANCLGGIRSLDVSDITVTVVAEQIILTGSVASAVDRSESERCVEELVRESVVINRIAVRPTRDDAALA